MANQIPQSKQSKNNIVFDSDEEAIRVLSAEGRKLEDCCKKVWRQYLASYKPKTYAVHLTGVKGRRTNNSLNSIKLGKVKKISDDEYGIEVTFRNDLAYHNSVIGSSQPKGHAIMLIIFGWKVKKGKHRNIEHFGYRQGYDYLGKVEKMYNKIKDKRISLEIQWLGNKNYTK